MKCLHRQDADIETLFLHRVKLTSLEYEKGGRDGFCPTPLVVTKLLNNLILETRQMHYTVYFLFHTDIFC
jgi:hypothetical protein